MESDLSLWEEKLEGRANISSTANYYVADLQLKAAAQLTAHQQLARRAAGPLTSQQLPSRAAGPLTSHQQLANRGAPPLSCPQQLASGRTPLYLLTYPTEQQTTGVDGLLHSYLPEQTPSTPSTIVIEGVPYFYLMPAVIAGGQDAHVYESFASE